MDSQLGRDIASVPPIPEECPPEPVTIAGYNAAIQLWLSASQGFWTRVNALLLTNSIILVAVVNCLSGSPRLPLAAMFLCVAGILLSWTWRTRIERSAINETHYHLSAAALEQCLHDRIGTAQRSWRFNHERKGERGRTGLYMLPRIEPNQLQFKQPITERKYWELPSVLFGRFGSVNITTTVFVLAYMVLFVSALMSLSYVGIPDSKVDELFATDIAAQITPLATPVSGR